MEQFSEDEFKVCLKKLNDPSIKWKKERSKGKKNVQVFTSKDKSGKYWTKTIISNSPIPLEHIYAMFLNVDVRERVEDRVRNSKIMKREGKSDIVYFEINLPIPFSNRDVLMARRWEFGNGKDVSGGIYIATKSIKLDSIPEQYPNNPKGIVRANMQMIRKYVKNENGTQMEILSLLDLKGKVPSKISKLISKKVSYGAFGSIVDAVEILKKEGKIPSK